MEVSAVLAVMAGHEWGGAPWWFLFPLFWVAVVIGLAFLFRRGWYHRQGGSGEAVLGERYARGEITEEEYRRRKAVLRERSR